jgi:parallel beta-helix repeat protein
MDGPALTQNIYLDIAILFSMDRRIISISLAIMVILASFVFIDLTFSIISDVEATTLYVGGSGPENHSTINEATIAAIDGDTVFVYNGTYFENLYINKAIKLIGEDKNITIIDGQGIGGSVIRIRTDWLNISGFSIINRTDGIYMDASSNVSISDCIIDVNRHGVHIDYSDDIRIINNDFVKGGVFIYGFNVHEYNSHNMTGNTVDNKPLLFLRNRKGYTISGDPVGQLIIVNCSEINADNLTIIGTNVGIEAAYSTKIDIRDSLIMEITEYGVFLDTLSHSNFEGNNISDIYETSIFMRYSNNNVISDNIFQLNYMYGLNLVGSSFNTIAGNNISHNLREGISFSSSTFNTIIRNNIIDNDPGISVVASSGNNRIISNNFTSNTKGINLGTSGYNEISYNSIYGNDYGIYYSWIKSSDKCNNITRNTIINNNYGVYIRESTNNYVFHNILVNNTVQAFDDSNDANQWDNGYPSGGNYWSDYTGVDLNGTSTQDVPPPDGIGDSAYTIDADSHDDYPLMNPSNNFTFLYGGWNLISINQIQMNANLSYVLASIYEYYDSVQWYDVEDYYDHWKHNFSRKPSHLNDLHQIDHKMGFWIHITEPNGVLFNYPGIVPSENQVIKIYKGWNLVGYPSLSTKNRTKALNNLTFGDEVDAIWSYNPATKSWLNLGSDDTFEIGYGYWIHAKTECEWEVPI